MMQEGFNATQWQVGVLNPVDVYLYACIICNFIKVANI